MRKANLFILFLLLISVLFIFTQLWVAVTHAVDTQSPSVTLNTAGNQISSSPTFYVGSGEDDAVEQGDGVFQLSETVCRVYSHTDPSSSIYRCSGLRFPNVTVPQGATITSAVLSVSVTGTYYDDVNCKIYANDVDDAENFQDDQNIINETERPRTSSYESWVEDSIGADWQDSPNIKTVIQEIVDRSNWIEGNALALLLIANTNDLKLLSFDSYEYSDHQYRAKLEINYTSTVNYKALSRQKEDFLYVNATVTDNVSVSKVLLSWYNGSWTNYTMTKYGSTNFYYKNMTKQASGIDYTFKIYANDTSNNWATYEWQKKDTDGNWATKYVRLNYTTTSWQYIQYYLYATSYTKLNDFVLNHEQGADGTTTDTGYLYTSKPTTDQERHCGRFTQFWVDENTTIDETTINNIYFHVWWKQDLGNQSKLWYVTYHEDGMIKVPSSYKEEIDTLTLNESGIWLPYNKYNYTLSYGFFDANKNLTIDDNTIYDFGIYLERVFTAIQPHYPSIVDAVNMSSYVIVNLPDNTTLQEYDSDNDGLSDFNELYMNLTDPKHIDTDNDGCSDYHEAVIYNTDPLNGSDYPPGYNLNLRVMDWDLADIISGAYVYSNGDIKTSDANGWANWTSLVGIIQVKVKYYGFWVNGSFSVMMDSDKTIEVRCKLYDAYFHVVNNIGNPVSGANVTAYNTTALEHQIGSEQTNSSGYAYIINLPNSTSLPIAVYYPDNTTLRANTTRNISSDEVVTSDITINRFSLVTLYKVHLDLIEDFYEGNNLVVVFYDFQNRQEANTTIWSITPPENVTLSVDIQHPLNKGIENVTLVVTDSSGNIISTVESFIVTRSIIMQRISEIDVKWVYASSEEKRTLFGELVDIDGQWPYAPS